jgi:flagellar biosynthesis protein FlhG
MREQSLAYDQAARLREIAGPRTSRRRSGKSRVITFTSGKGGVGKSTVALNIGVALSRSGKRVLLVDGDANLGNLDIMMGVSPRYRLGDVLCGARDIEDVLVEPLPNLKLLAGNSGEPGSTTMNDRMQEEFLDSLFALDEPFDFILIDSAAGLTSTIVAYALGSDTAVVVTNPEPTAVMDAYAVIKLIALASHDKEIGVLMNGARVPARADEAAQKLSMIVQHFLKREIQYLGCIPFDEHVSEAVTQQRPVLQLFPTTGASLSLQSLAHALIPCVKSTTIGRVLGTS